MINDNYFYRVARKVFYPTRPDYVTKRLYLYFERRFFKRNRVLSGPVQVKLNTGYKCNLRCPLCPTGRRMPGHSDELTIDKARYLLTRIGTVYNISLFGWGEPFLNKDIFDIISLLKKSHKYVYIDSNLSIKNELIIDRAANANIDYLSVSIDGVDQHSYSQYRFGGSFETVSCNIASLRAATNGPKRIELQYLLSKKNIQYVEKAKKLAEQLGVFIRFMNIGMYVHIFYESTPNLKAEWWTREQMINEENLNRRARLGVCHYMYNEPFIDTDGRLYPCCNAPHAPLSFLEAGFQNVFGDLHKNTLNEIWNNEYYQYARSIFSGRPYSGRQVKPICLKCRVYLMTLGSRPSGLCTFTGDNGDSPLESLKCTLEET